jgi:ribosome-binding protein aMBF1 (putative translation factor)
MSKTKARKLKVVGPNTKDKYCEMCGYRAPFLKRLYYDGEWWLVCEDCCDEKLAELAEPNHDF